MKSGAKRAPVGDRTTAQSSTEEQVALLGQ
jgi:hypothetical protein